MPRKRELEDLTVEELLTENNVLAEQRAGILARQRAITAELEIRAEAIEEERRANAAVLGQTNRPRTQGVFGDVEEENG